jgi:hypothetical protein
MLNIYIILILGWNCWFSHNVTLSTIIIYRCIQKRNTHRSCPMKWTNWRSSLLQLIRGKYMSVWCIHKYSQTNKGIKNICPIIRILLSIYSEKNYFIAFPKVYLTQFYISYRIIQTGSGAHPASCPMDTAESFPGGKAGETWSWPLTSI